MSRRSRYIANSRFGPAASALLRTSIVAKHLGHEVALTTRWLFNSREHTNLTFELSDVNLQQLEWWVADAASISVEQARTYIAEIRDDEQFKKHVRDQIAASTRGKFADQSVRLHKRLGWYALVRALKPEIIVETGTDKGLGALVFAAALRRNGNGKVITLDVNPEAGYLLSGPYAQFVDLRIGDSIELLEKLACKVDVFVHDSLHTYEHEMAEFRAVAPHLVESAHVVSDFSHASSALADWAQSTGRRFKFFAEIPEAHWFRGEGIGLALPPSARP